jgi:hypothetical protein
MTNIQSSAVGLAILDLLPNYTEEVIASPF